MNAEDAHSFCITTERNTAVGMTAESPLSRDIREDSTDIPVLSDCVAFSIVFNTRPQRVRSADIVRSQCLGRSAVVNNVRSGALTAPSG